MSLLTQAMLFERFNRVRVNLVELGELLGISRTTLYQQISDNTCPVPTYLDGGQRWADIRDVAEHFDAKRQEAKAERENKPVKRRSHRNK